MHDVNISVEMLDKKYVLKGPLSFNSARLDKWKFGEKSQGIL